MGKKYIFLQGVHIFRTSKYGFAISSCRNLQSGAEQTRSAKCGNYYRVFFNYHKWQVTR